MRIAAIFRIFASIFCGSSAADDATIAVAANFALPMERLEADFETRTGHELTVVTGSTGQLYAQIVHGAPFDVFLSADVERVDALEARGGIVEGERFTYAIGRLVLVQSAEGVWINPDPIFELGASAADIAPMEAPLIPLGGARLALANPDLAPYGAAAAQALPRVDGFENWEAAAVYGQDVSQAFAFLLSGAADMTVVSRSLLQDAPRREDWISWDIPAELHDPIRQDAALLPRAAENPAAIAFFAYLRGEEARALIEASGYRLD